MRDHAEDRRRACEQVRLWQTRDYVIVDTETTGLGPAARVVELAIINRNGQVIIDTMVNPQIPIPPTASRIHGITDEMVRDAPLWAQIHDRVADAIRDKLMLAYNADYDVQILRQTAAAAGCRLEIGQTGCLMREYAAYRGEWNDYHGSYRWQPLGRAARDLGVSVDGAHRALADCRMTEAIMKEMARAERSAPRITWGHGVGVER